MVSKKILVVSADNFYNNAKNFFQSELSSDNLVLTNILLRQRLIDKNISIHCMADTKDPIESYDLIIFNEFPIKGTIQMKLFQSCLKRPLKKILIAMESEVVRKEYRDLQKFLKVFDLVFSWNEDFSNYKNFRKVNFSSYLESSFDPEKERKLLCCIAAKKIIDHPKALYRKRLQLIKDLEYLDLEFDLYGHGWGKFVIPWGKVGSAVNRILRMLPDIKIRRSWRGSVSSKRPILETYDFSLVVENANEMPGYITEKILHVLNAGGIPLYLGEKNIEKIIPKDLFIDLRYFSDARQLKNIIKEMPLEEKKSKRYKIKRFIRRSGLKKFTPDWQANIIFKGISEVLN